MQPSVNTVVPSITRSAIYLESFRRSIFGFIVDTDKGTNERQREAMDALTDMTTSELLYGGAAGGGKSWIGCSWLIMMCELYPGTRWFIAREELKRIKGTTYLTFLKVAKAYGFTFGVDFKYNGQDNYIIFANGSRIDLLDVALTPKDPEYERFGSFEFTGGWIEEAGEVNFKAYDVLRTRIGRQHNDKYGILPKLFITCNPKKNWLYRTFYLPSKKGTLSPEQKFITAFVQDNPHVDSGYIGQLQRIKDESTRQRLLFGNWEYDDDPTAMCSYTNISAIFTNSHVRKTGVKYIVADIARYGSDRARIGVFDGWVLIEHISFDISATTEIQMAILALQVKHQVPRHRTIADEDGVGGGVVDNCEILGFLNGGSPIILEDTEDNPQQFQKLQIPNYANLQTQCVYHLAEVINANGFYVECDLSEGDKEEICTELGWMKTYKVDDERKLRILPKEKIKENIGHSPDWRDLFMMRSRFDLGPTYIESYEIGAR